MGFLTEAQASELVNTARKLTAKGKGLLAADESTGTIKKRFDSIAVENTEANRAAFRSLLFTTPGLGEFISGSILYEETLYQKNNKGETMVSLLEKQDIIPGIKVDKGLVNIPGTDEEKSTEGMDGLGKRCAEYYKAGARFAKWRAALSIDPVKGKPSSVAIKNTTDNLAQYALISQANGLVPIVEPEILSDGSHSISVCAKITEKVLVAQYKALSDYNVFLPGTLLKPNMVTSGSEASIKDSPAAVGYYTVQALKNSVPPSVPGIMFLSGGQSEEESSLNLNAINQADTSPWVLSFSFGRALQASCLKSWLGKEENTQQAQQSLLIRAKANSQAQMGKYQGGMGGAAAGASLFEKKYVY